MICTRKNNIFENYFDYELNVANMVYDRYNSYTLAMDLYNKYTIFLASTLFLLTI